MAKTIKEERLRWVIPIWKKETRLVDAIKVCPYSKRSLERWLSVYRKQGAWALEPKSTEPKRYRVETAIRIRPQRLPVTQEAQVMCTHIWRFSLEWVNEHMYGQNNQRREA